MIGAVDGLHPPALGGLPVDVPLVASSVAPVSPTAVKRATVPATLTFFCSASNSYLAAFVASDEADLLHALGEVDPLRGRRLDQVHPVGGRDEAAGGLVPGAAVPPEGLVDGDEEALHHALGERAVGVLRRDRRA